MLNFREEVTYLKSLDHPSICKLMDVFEDTNNIYLILEYCAGGELLERIEDDNVMADEREAASVVRQIA